MNAKDRSDYYKAYYLKNREKILLKRKPYQELYRDEHKDEKKNYDEIYRKNKNFIYRTLNKEHINAKRREYYHNKLKKNTKYLERQSERRLETNKKNLARYHRNKKLSEEQKEREKLEKKRENDMIAKSKKKTKHQLQVEKEQRYHQKLIKLYEKNGIFKI